MDAQTPSIELNDAQKTTRLKITMNTPWLPCAIPAATALEDGSVRLEYVRPEDPEDGTSIILDEAGDVVDMEIRGTLRDPRGEVELTWQNCRGGFLWKSLHKGLHKDR